MDQIIQTIKQNITLQTIKYHQKKKKINPKKKFYKIKQFDFFWSNFLIKMFLYYFFFKKNIFPICPKCTTKNFVLIISWIFRDSFTIDCLLIFQKITRYFLSSNLPMYNVKIYDLCIFKVFVCISQKVFTLLFIVSSHQPILLIPRKIF